MIRILIGCPTCNLYEYCIEDYLKSVKSLECEGFNFDLLLVDNSKDDEFFNKLKQKGINVEKVQYSETARQRLVDSRNLILKKAIEGNYDYFFSLEQDIIIPPDSLKKLLSVQKDIVCGYYGNVEIFVLRDNQTGEIIHAPLEIPLIWLNAGNGRVVRANANQVLNKGVIEIATSGLGCMLISRNVFTKIKFRFNEQKEIFDDTFFAIDAKFLGHKIFLNSDVVAQHLHNEWEKNIKK